MSKPAEPKLKASRYGIGEWFGHPIGSISAEDRRTLAKAATNSKIKKNCPFRGGEASQKWCNKKGGVCSIVTYTQDVAGDVAVGRAGELVTTCPSRFWAGNDLFKVIGREILQCDAPIIVKEVGFLASVDGKSDRDVGRIDTVLVSNNNGLADWCAIEIQAVYFSGDSMGPEFENLGRSSGMLPFPVGKRRPDFRSSGPKRLMPQLQIKVPTLRRWGKKMGVIVDRPFFESLGAMRREAHLSNADIVWYVVSYQGRSNKIVILDRVYTTLESSVEALTAGQSVTKDQFEREINECLADPKASLRGKVVKVS